MATKKKAAKKKPANKTDKKKSGGKTNATKLAAEETTEETKPAVDSTEENTIEAETTETSTPVDTQQELAAPTDETTPTANPELKKFAATIEKVLADHTAALPMSKTEAIQFVKKSNPKFRCTIKDADVAKGTHTVTVFLGNEGIDLKPIKLH